MRKTPPSPKPSQPLDWIVADDPPRRMVQCVICSSETLQGSVEGMCWVCRRLKISAWRDSEPMPAQE